MSSRTSSDLAGFLCKYSKPNGEFTMNDMIGGIITIIPKFDIQFKHIYYKIYWEIEPSKGGGKVQSISTKQHLAKAYGYWKKGESYDYHFDFKPVSPLTFKGAYFDVNWYVEVEVELTRTGIETMRKQAMNKLQLMGMVFPRSKAAFRFPFTVERGNKPFRVGASYKHVDFTTALAPYYIGTGIGLLGVVFGWQAWMNFTLPIFEIIGSSALGVGAYNMFVGFGKLQHVHFNVKPLRNNNFELSVDVQKNWRSIEAVHLEYSINQELESEEGDSDSYEARKVIELFRYESPQEYPIQEAITKIAVPLPQNRIGLPPSLHHSPFNIYWELELTLLLTSGQKKTFRHSIFVTL